MSNEDPKGLVNPDHKSIVRTDTETQIPAIASSLESLLKGMHPTLSSAPIFNLDAQNKLHGAHLLEETNRGDEALPLYEAALDDLASGQINASVPGSTIEEARSAFVAISRLGGHTGTAFEKLRGLYRRIVSPQEIVRIADYAEQHNSYLTKKADLSRPLPEIISQLPENDSEFSDQEEIRMLRNALKNGLEKASKAIVNELRICALSAQRTNQSEAVDQFLADARLVAQLPMMNIKAVLEEKAQPSDPPRYNGELALIIAKTLQELGREKESAELALDHGSGEKIRFLSGLVPGLLKTNPHDPEVLKITNRFLSEANFEKNEHWVSSAILKIALILQKEYGINLQSLPALPGQISSTEEKR